MTQVWRQLSWSVWSAWGRGASWNTAGGGGWGGDLLNFQSSEQRSRRTEPVGGAPPLSPLALQPPRGAGAGQVLSASWLYRQALRVPLERWSVCLQFISYLTERL